MAPCAPYPQGWGFRERCISFFLFLLFIYLFFREVYFFLFFFWRGVFLPPQPTHPSPDIPLSLLTQFLVGLGARALGLAGGWVPAVVTLGNLPHVDIHGHSLGFV